MHRLGIDLSTRKSAEMSVLAVSQVNVHVTSNICVAYRMATHEVVSTVVIIFSPSCQHLRFFEARICRGVQSKAPLLNYATATAFQIQMMVNVMLVVNALGCPLL